MDFDRAIDGKTAGPDGMIRLAIAYGASQGCRALAKAWVPGFSEQAAALVRFFPNRNELSVNEVTKSSQIAGQRKGFHAPRKTA